LMASPAAKALIANAYVASPVDTFNSSNAATKAISDEFVKDYGKKNAKGSVEFGYAQAKMSYEILNQACQDKDLTRAGVIKAAHELSGVDTGGVVAGSLDYTKVGQPATRSVYLTRPANVIGGAKTIGNGPQ